MNKYISEEIDVKDAFGAVCEGKNVYLRDRLSSSLVKAECLPVRKLAEICTGLTGWSWYAYIVKEDESDV